MSLEVLGDDLDTNGNKIRGKKIHIKSTRDDFTIEIHPGDNFVLREGKDVLATLTAAQLAAVLLGTGGGNGEREVQFELFGASQEVTMDSFDLFAAFDNITVSKIHIHTWNDDTRGAGTFTLELARNGMGIATVSDDNLVGIKTWGEVSGEFVIAKMNTVSVNLTANPSGASGGMHVDFPRGLIITLTYSITS